MIGQVVKEGRIWLTLSDDLEWKSRIFPNLARMMNGLHAGTFTEWNGQPGRWQLEDAAKLVGGKVVRITAA